MSFFSQSPRRGVRASQGAQFLPGTAANFSPGQFARNMPQPMQRTSQPPTANPPFAVNEPVQVKRPGNAQLGSSTPMSQPAFREPIANPNPNTVPVGNQQRDPRSAPSVPMPMPQVPVRPGYGDIGTPEVPPIQNGPPLTMPSESFPVSQNHNALLRRSPYPTTPSDADILYRASQQNPDTTGPQQPVEQMPDPVTPVQRPNREPVNPGFVPPSASWYDRSGAGPGIGAVTDLASQMAVKAQTGTLTVEDALAAEQAGDPALAAAIRNAVAGMGWNYAPQAENFMAPPPPANSGVTYPTPARRPYRTFAPGASGGVYTG
jgi:hypothetical protein